MNILKLIRYKNLIFIAVLQLVIYYSLICPTMLIFGMHLYAPTWVMMLLFLATIFVAAGGYVINDYFDIKIDRINRPHAVIITNTISKKGAMRLYQALTIIGVLLSLVAAVMLRSFTIAFIYLIVPGMLWFYSASYKRQLIIGNLIVSLAAALVPIIPLIAEVRALELVYPLDLLQATPVLYTLYTRVCFFALAAFIFTFAREIIKDMQDQEGDREMECHTIPIVWGELVAKIVVTAILLIGCALTMYASIAIAFPGSVSLRYALCGIVLPTLCLLGILFSRSCTAYRNASNMLKFIMAVGTLYPLIYYYLVSLNYKVPLFGLFQILGNA